MLTTGFSVQGASLKLMCSGERGVITRLATLPAETARSLQAMGLVLGQTITLEQRFPRFTIRVENRRYTLSEAATCAIYVRIVDH